jgi:hypothetical protein
MKRTRFQTCLAAIACVGLVLPQGILAAQPTAGPTDVALRSGGMLVGQVVDAQGAVQAGKLVSIQYGEQEVARTTTDANGVFAAQGLRGGQYHVVADNGDGHFRLWADNTAPPAATDSVVVVADPNVVRGQWSMPGAQYGAGWLNWVRSHPYITAGIVAAAVAIPLALADDDDGGPRS